MDGHSSPAECCSFTYTRNKSWSILLVHLGITCEKSGRPFEITLFLNYCDYWNNFELRLIVILLNLLVFFKQIENLDPRGIQLSALFMSGVDMALFANDACGQPIPWEHCCPWMYFDGKLFQTKLIKASREKVPLIDLCDGQVRSAKWDRVSGAPDFHQFISHLLCVSSVCF